MKIDVAGVLIDNVSKDETITKIDSFVASGQPHYVVTPYSEIIVFAQRDEHYKNALNEADLALPDGIGVLWAAKYLEEGRLFRSLLEILLNPKSAYSVIREKVTGSRLIYYLGKLATEKKYTLALVGGADSVAAQTAYELKKKYPELIINLAISGGHPFDDRTISEINKSNSDILLIGYSPPKQELWLYENYQKLNVKVAIGLGGTFDEVAGKRAATPNFMHHAGLEWLWRLITHPSRIRRIWNAVPVFIWKVYKYKHGTRS